MNVERELQAALRRVTEKVDQEVRDANRRISEYTPTEWEEVEAGLRDSPKVAAVKRAATGFEALGEAWASLVAGARAAAEAFERGFKNWEKQ